MNNDELANAKFNKELAEIEAPLLICISSIITSTIQQIAMSNTETVFTFSKPLSIESTKRLTALGFEVDGLSARSPGRLSDAFSLLKSKISSRFNEGSVENVVVDDEFANVSATVNGRSNTDCGYLEDYA